MVGTGYCRDDAVVDVWCPNEPPSSIEMKSGTPRKTRWVRYQVHGKSRIWSEFDWNLIADFVEFDWNMVRRFGLVRSYRCRPNSMGIWSKIAPKSLRRSWSKIAPNLIEIWPEFDRRSHRIWFVEIADLDSLDVTGFSRNLIEIWSEIRRNLLRIWSNDWSQKNAAAVRRRNADESPMNRWRSPPPESCWNSRIRYWLEFGV